MNPIAWLVDHLGGGAKMVLVTLALSLAAMAGGWINGVFKAREIAHLQTALEAVQREHAEQWRIFAEAAAARLQAAQARGDALTEELAAASRQADALRGELDEQITLATQGRACLDAAALRVLDRAPGIAAAPARVPAYVVFPDATLREIAIKRPRTLSELAAISGVGDRKLEHYGTAILEMVAQAS